MQFRISDTFTDSLTKLTADEQKAVKITAFDLQQNPANPGMQFHRIEKSKDKHFWSVRIGSDLRLIVHKTEGSFLLCYADHHDKAYQWAERRRLETHPTTGAAQWVEIRERVVETILPSTSPVITATPDAAETAPDRKPRLFAHCTDQELLSYGVPLEWLADVKVADEDSLFLLTEHLPAEASEALIELATGGKPATVFAHKPTDPFEHPDAQRRFRVMTGVEELEQALDFPWEKWSIFLHPSQLQWVTRSYSGPARISGSAGTGKTIVALHRAVTLAKEHPDARVWLTTFSSTLANSLTNKVNCLIHNQPRLAERLEVADMNTMGMRLFERTSKSNQSKHKLVTQPQLRELLQSAIDKFKLNNESALLQRFSLNFVQGEWNDVVDAWQLTTWEEYRDIKRLGRKTRLNEQQRHALWDLFQIVKDELGASKLLTLNQMFTLAANQVAELAHPPFDFVVVDEAQDISVGQLKLLAAIASIDAGPKESLRSNSLFFAGDLGQRIFQQPFSWKSLGVDVRGRSRTLTINYRTSHQIRTQADRLLGPDVSDLDGNVESRKGTISIFNGPAPVIKSFQTQQAEIDFVAAWLTETAGSGIAPHEFGIFVRSSDQMERTCKALAKAKIPFTKLDDYVETIQGKASVCSMHLAKGLEFKAVAVMACDDDVLPLQSRIESVMDEADLEEIYNTERHLLYVACTRARDLLLITSTQPPSEFIDDLAN